MMKMSDAQSKNDDNLPAWSVRDVPRDVRTAALNHAKKAGVSTGEYVAQAIRDKIKADRNGGKAVAVRGPVSMSEASAVVDMIGRLSGAGVELPSSLQKSAVAMMSKVVREVSKGQTGEQKSQTNEQASQTDEGE